MKKETESKTQVEMRELNVQADKIMERQTELFAKEFVKYFRAHPEAFLYVCGQRGEYQDEGQGRGTGAGRFWDVESCETLVSQLGADYQKILSELQSEELKVHVGIQEKVVKAKRVKVL